MRADHISQRVERTPEPSGCAPRLAIDMPTGGARDLWMHIAGEPVALCTGSRTAAEAVTATANQIKRHSAASATSNSSDGPLSN